MWIDDIISKVIMFNLLKNTMAFIKFSRCEQRLFEEMSPLNLQFKKLMKFIRVTDLEIKHQLNINKKKKKKKKLCSLNFF